MALVVEECTVEDLHTLQEISYNTFYETFSEMNTKENMDNYVKNAFDIKKLEKELNTPNSTFYFIYEKEKLAGYLKVNIKEAQTEEMGEESLEVERIYISEAFQHQGLGKYLFNRALEIAKEQKKSKIWLGVWEENEKALRFYRKLGFVQTGSHTFYMGDDPQTDFILTKSLDI